MEKSDNRLASWMFDMVVDVLSAKSNLGDKAPIKVEFCHLSGKKKLRKIGKIYVGLVGTTDEPEKEDFWRIRIEDRMSERSKIRVFLHEMLHILFQDEDRENPILKLEYLLWPNLSED